MVDLAEQRVGIAGAPHDLDPAGAEHVLDALAGQDRVVGHDYAQGISARRRSAVSGRMRTKARARSG